MTEVMYPWPEVMTDLSHGDVIVNYGLRVIRPCNYRAVITL